MVRIKAPELPSFPWLNCDSPLSLQNLRGRIVLLDFWTYGCINCLHILPDLQKLEQKYKDSLTVIGVHSAKFDHEDAIDSIQQAILRYGVTHPVLVDRNFQLWQQYVVRAYPTQVVIDPAGYIVKQVAGEGHAAAIDELIGKLSRQGAIALDLTQKPQEIPVSLENVSLENVSLEKQPIASPLAFPGKVLADQHCLYIADSGHDRIVIAHLSGTIQHVVGTGRAGYRDGSFAEAQFSNPQGMAIDPHTQRLYVADTDNHAIRQIDLQRQTVETIAGTGAQNRQLRPQQGQALQLPLNSPWDLALVDRLLFVAMAGSHQIWALDLPTGALRTYLGTGAEACFDGAIDQAAFAQPSGIVSNGQNLDAPNLNAQTLYVADSEGSTIRAVCLGEQPVAQTVCGSGDLFGFGDRDGQAEAVRLQHCMGICLGNYWANDWGEPPAEPWLWIADTYNHKIKRVQVRSGICETVLGSGQPGSQDGEQPQFYEPSGLSAVGSQLFIADTNNHAVRRVDLQTMRVETIAFPKLCAPNLCFPAEFSSDFAI